MATIKDAYDYGVNVGEGIAKSNISDLEDMSAEDFEGQCIETESDHFRQFSPFEFYAADFDLSRNPDSTWEAYERGVGVGIRRVIRRWKRENR